MTIKPRQMETNEPVSDNPRLAEAMEEYLEQLESGIRPDRTAILARYADIAEELGSCLEGLDFIHCVAPELKEGEPGRASNAERTRRVATLGDFRIVREIGRGGMAVVYEAEQLSLGRAVALKVLPFASMLDERQLKRFQNEARAVASLNHPHIVPVYGFGTDRGVHFYAMRLIEGQSLDHVLRHCQERASGEQRAVSASQSGDKSQSIETHGDAAAFIDTHLSLDGNGLFRWAARVGAQAAEALEHAHAHGILHRDVKPGNLLIDAHGFVWVSDFGLARIGANLGVTRSGDVVGTYRYMSPEQLMGKPLLVDPRSDVYSLGATLYELVTLRPVFDASDRQQLLKQIGMEEIPAPRKINKLVPAALSTIIHKCIQKDPAERYASAQELAEDLRRFLDDKAILAQPATQVEKASRWLRRYRSLAWTAAAVMAVISCGLAMGIWRISQERAEVVRQRDLVQKYLYVADLKIASDVARSAKLPQLRTLLDRHLPKVDEQDLRGFPWFYLNHLYAQSERTRRESLVLRGHNSDVYFVTYSPDGTLIASASKDHTARLWDAASGRYLRTLRGHTSEVNCASFAPDGKTIATASDDRSVRVWDVATGEELFPLTGFTRIVIRVQFSPDGKTLAATEAVLEAADVSTTFWDVSTRTITNRWNDRLILGFSPGGTEVATSSRDVAVRLQDPATGAVKATMWGHRGQVPAGAFCSNGTLLVTADEQSTVFVWHVETGREVMSFNGQETQLRTIAFSPDGKYLAAAGRDGIVRIWHLLSGTLYAVLESLENQIWSLAFSHNGEHLLAGGADGTVRRWSLAHSSAQISLPEHTVAIHGIAFSAEGMHLATASHEPCAYLWNLPRCTTSKTISIESTAHSSVVISLAFSPTDSRLVLADNLGKIFVVDAPSGREVTTWQAYPHVSALTISKDGRYLATAHSSVRIVQVWDLDSGSLRHEVAYEGYIRSISFSADGKEVAAAGGEGLIRWDLSQGPMKRIGTVNSKDKYVSVFAFSPDGKWSAAVVDAKSIVIRSADMIREHTTLLGHTGQVSALAFSPDGKTLVSGSHTGEIKLWDLATGQGLFDLPGHTGAVRHIAFSSDGQMLATGGESRDGRGEAWLWFAPHLTMNGKTVLNPNSSGN